MSKLDLFNESVESFKKNLSKLFISDLVSVVLTFQIVFV